MGNAGCENLLAAPTRSPAQHGRLPGAGFQEIGWFGAVLSLLMRAGDLCHARAEGSVLFSRHASPSLAEKLPLGCAHRLVLSADMSNMYPHSDLPAPPGTPASPRQFQWRLVHPAGTGALLPAAPAAPTLGSHGPESRVRAAWADERKWGISAPCCTLSIRCWAGERSQSCSCQQQFRQLKIPRRGDTTDLPTSSIYFYF